MNNNLPNPDGNGGMAKKITVLTIVVLLILAVFFVAYLMKKPSVEGPANIPESADGFPEVFYSYLGTIQAIEGNKIVLLATAAKNYLSEDQTINVLTDENTIFIRQDKNFDINDLQPGASGEFYKTTKISLGELKAGEEITVIDYDNIKGKKEFTAKRVEATK